MLCSTNGEHHQIFAQRREYGVNVSFHFRKEKARGLKLTFLVDLFSYLWNGNQGRHRNGNIRVPYFSVSKKWRICMNFVYWLSFFSTHPIVFCLCITVESFLIHIIIILFVIFGDCHCRTCSENHDWRKDNDQNHLYTSHIKTKRINNQLSSFLHKTFDCEMESHW